MTVKFLFLPGQPFQHYGKVNVWIFIRKLLEYPADDSVKFPLSSHKEQINVVIHDKIHKRRQKFGRNSFRAIAMPEESTYRYFLISASVLLLPEYG